jgi:hypothetical protein
MLGRGNESSKISLLAICRFMSDIMVRAEPPECARRHERDNSMKKQSALLAALALLITTGVASAQDQTPRKNQKSADAPKSSGSVARNRVGLAKTFPTWSAGTSGTKALLEDHLHGGDTPRSAR